MGRKCKNEGLRLVGIILVIVGVGLCVAGVRYGKYIAESNKNESSVVATITNITSYENSKGKEETDVYVTYEIDGQTYETQLYGYSFTWYKGKKLTLSYNPNDPYDVSAQELEYMSVIMICTVGLVSLVIACKLLLGNKIQVYRAKRKKAKVSNQLH
ncbi:DUF3592 domain-containing protein [Anaerosporobacter faecicola]|uniref:DUF3592 domain-containing protein n=1 Tax=Anaerosporobacter faecicola TaxID=2718714 RepID=UPI0014390DA0|nr:DUF3592 domain-containing protein [Anaerosporobacter faecicola]